MKLELLLVLLEVLLVLLEVLLEQQTQQQGLDNDDRSAVAVVALVVGIVDVVVEDAAAGGSPEVETSLWVAGGSWSGLEAEAGGREDSPLSRCSWPRT